MTEVNAASANDLGIPLAPAVLGDRADLSPQAKQAIKSLCRRGPWSFLFHLVLAWTIVLGGIALAHLLQEVWVSVLVVLVVASRQNVLALLMHEQVHRLAFRSRAGDLLCNLTCAYPLLITLEGYRAVHLAHHDHFFTERDPDYTRKQGVEWALPLKGWRLVRSLLLDLLAVNVWRVRQSKAGAMPAAGEAKPLGSPWLRPTYYLALAALLWWTETWPLFLLYWLLPLVTVFQVIIRWAALCEHQYNLRNPSIAQATPFIRLRWWESLFLPDLGFHTYHIYHHWYPAVPCRDLPRIDAIIRQEGLLREENVFHGYREFLGYLMGRGRRVSSLAERSSPIEGEKTVSLSPRGRGPG